MFLPFVLQGVPFRRQYKNDSGTLVTRINVEKDIKLGFLLE
jgi:hypothetical protein